MGKKNLNIKLPDAMLDELETIRRERSQQEGRRVSRNSLIEEAVEKYVTAAEKFLEGLFQEGNVKPDQPYQISVREFLGRHMDDRISMMTPGGYVDLDKAQTERLLSGQTVKAHPGCREDFRDIPSEELLPQSVLSAHFRDGVWRLLTDTERGTETIRTVCYDTEDIWKSRYQAKQFFLRAMAACEGSEKERYTNIYMKLMMGMTDCDDSEV